MNFHYTFFCRDDLFFTAGATHGIHLVTTVLLNADTPVFVEDPSFFNAIGMFVADYGCPVIPGNTYAESHIVHVRLEFIV
jgi:DNA-binding transcriptional MocR family regulator